MFTLSPLKLFEQPLNHLKPISIATTIRLVIRKDFKRIRQRNATRKTKIEKNTKREEKMDEIKTENGNFSETLNTHTNRKMAAKKRESRMWEKRICKWIFRFVCSIELFLVQCSVFRIPFILFYSYCVIWIAQRLFRKTCSLPYDSNSIWFFTKKSSHALEMNLFFLLIWSSWYKIFKWA